MTDANMPPNSFVINRLNGKNTGYTLLEVMLAVAIVGVISALTIQGLVTMQGEQRGLHNTKTIADQLLKAKSQISQSDPTVSPSAESLADQTQYTRKTPCGVALTPPGGSEFTCPNCMCYQYSNGSILQVEDNGASTDPRLFNYDPDSATDPGGLPPVSLRYYTASGRITSRGNDTGTFNLDPAYAQIWGKQ